MKAQIKFLRLSIIVITLSTYSCIPGPLPPISADWMAITYLDSKGSFLIDTVDNPSTVNYNDIVVSRVLPDGTVREFRGDSLPLIFMKNKKIHIAACVLITNGWLSEPYSIHLSDKKVNGDYTGNRSEVTTYIKLCDSLPVDTIMVEVTHKHRRYKAFKSVHGYTKVYFNGDLVHERTIDDMIDVKNVCRLTITK